MGELAAAGDLLERESELARVSEAFTDALAGHGRVIVISGRAGIGKTALLGEACELAAPEFRVLRARGGELETEFPHGLVRQLFEPELRERTADSRRPLLEGAAGLAAPVVVPDALGTAQRSSSDSAFSITHGLYWLTANLTDECPLMLAIDDVHWSDAGSLRFLVHLARRLDGLRLLVAICLRSDEPGASELLGELAAEGQVVRPAPLSKMAVAAIIASRTGTHPSAEFAAACHRSTGGIPFLLRELVSTLIEEGVEPSGAAVPRVEEVGPENVARAILRRLGRLSAGAVELARALAVLGVDARLHRAVQLAGLHERVALEAADGLEAMGILRRGRPLQFAHPIVRSAIYDDIPSGARSAAHARAAELLAAERADADSIATHLLVTDPQASQRTVRTLAEAADQALARGAPESAVAYLERALMEGDVDAQTRSLLLFALGKAERLGAPSAALEHFRQAHALAEGSVTRARIAYELVDTMVYIRPAWEDAAKIVEASIAEVQGEDLELAIRFEALRATNEFYDARLLPGLFERLSKLRELAGSASPGRRTVALLVGNLAAWLGEPREEILRLIDLGLDGGYSPAEESPESWLVPCAVQSLTLAEASDRGVQIADEALAISRERGSALGAAVASSCRGWAHARMGDLVSAEADTRLVLDAMKGLDLVVAYGGGIFHAIDPLIEREGLETDARRLQAVELELDPHSLWWPLWLEARGRLRLAFGDHAGGVDDLNRVEQTLYAHNNPNGWGWRPALALAIAREDRDRAAELLGIYRARAEEIGLPRAIGIGLRTCGLIEGDDDGLELLRESVRVLEGSPARLELARSMVEQGAALRRAGHRADARETLREGLDLAHRCGATRLERRAREELTATGARPRRSMITGRDALTPTERRIAGMAASGMSNPEIAQALFVTRKNVENHLGRVYAKLDIHSRTELAVALDQKDAQ